MRYITLLIVIVTFSEFSQAKINQPFGLFFVDKENDLENKEILLAPTLKTEVVVDVQGLLTTTTVKQYFINPTNNFMEAIYLFPLPEKSSVDHLLMKIGNRYIEGIIQKKEEAENTYQKAKSSGKKASLVSSSRPNIFKTKLANIEPGELIIVEIRYHDVISFKDDVYNLRIPTVINHRYILPKNIQKGDGLKEDYVIDENIHSPINTETSYTINPYSININLNAGFDISKPTSNVSIDIDKITSSHYKINLTEGTMPSTKDFILDFSAIKSKNPYIQIYGEEIEDDLFIYGLINPQIQNHDLQLMEKNAITVVADISGSMSGASLREMKSLLIDFINQLPEHHYLNIIAFHDDYIKLFNKPKELNTFNKMKVLKFVKSLRAEGGTNMMPPVYEAIFEKTDFSMKHQIVLATDGNIGFETGMMALVNEHIGSKRLHLVGIGSAPNTYLISNLSKVGRGSHVYSGGGTRVFEKKKAQELLYKINRPVIEDIRFVTMHKHEILPKKFPDVLANEPISFFVKFPYTKLEDLTKPITLKGNHGSKSWEFSINKDQIQEGKFLNQLWARNKIESLNFQKYIGAISGYKYENEVVFLALQNKIVTKFTSLVAVDENISRNSNIPIFSHKIPHNIPEGWEDPELLKEASSFMNKFKASGKKLIGDDEDSNSAVQSLQIHFVQTATQKELFYIMGIILTLLALCLFCNRKKLY